jgi:hypothetical protein
VGTLANIKVKNCSVTWGTDVAQVSEITCSADVSKSLQNKYFFFYTPAGIGHYCWINVNSEGVDPALTGFTPHAVAIATGASANTVAAAIEAVIEEVTGFNSTVSNAVITMTNTDTGYAQGPHDGNSGFTFEVTTEGSSSADLGYTEGVIDVSIDQKEAAISTHQTGSNKLGSVITGKEVKVKLTLYEATKAQITKMLRKMGGGSFTPTGASGTEVTGLGTHKDGDNTYTYADKLVLHPVSKASGDKSEDITFWKAFVKMDGLKFDGEKPLTLPITFEVFPDMSKNERVQYFAYGDGSQTLT